MEYFSKGMLRCLLLVFTAAYIGMVGSTLWRNFNLKFEKILASLNHSTTTIYPNLLLSPVHIVLFCCTDVILAECTCLTDFVLKSIYHISQVKVNLHFDAVKTSRYRHFPLCRISAEHSNMESKSTKHITMVNWGPQHSSTVGLRLYEMKHINTILLGEISPL